MTAAARREIAESIRPHLQALDEIASSLPSDPWSQRFGAAMGFYTREMRAQAARYEEGERK